MENIEEIINDVMYELFRKIDNNNDILTHPPGFTKIIKNNNDNNNDVWEKAIEDNKFLQINKITRIFPYLKNNADYNTIKIDEDSYNYITIKDIADIISKIICNHLINMNINPRRINIADYTAGVGGNALSFSKYFNKVYCIELDELRCKYLDNNLKIYNCDNYEIINGDSLKFNEERMIKDNIDVIFIDPPWGGSGYKYSENLRIKLGEMYMEELVIDIYNKFMKNENNNNNKLVVLKLPKNYDIESFYQYIKKNNENNDNYTIYCKLYIMNKMLIIVCELINYYL